MISKNIKHLCLNYTQIENYNEAINDMNETWHCHHRLEINDDYINTREDLKLMNLYYNRPPEELIFLKCVDHIKLHQNNFQTARYSEEMDFRKWILFATEIYIVVR
jgi:hypothetical protein